MDPTMYQVLSSFAISENWKAPKWFSVLISKDITNKRCKCMKRCRLWRTQEVNDPWRTDSLWVPVTPPLCRDPFREGGLCFWRMCSSSCVELGGIPTDCLVLLLLLYFRLTSFHLESVSVALLFRLATPPPPFNTVTLGQSRVRRQVHIISSTNKANTYLVLGYQIHLWHRIEMCSDAY